MDNYLRISVYVKASMAINVGSNFVTVALLILFLVVLKMDVSGSVLAALWRFGLDGIWFNLFGTSVLSAILAVVLQIRVKKEIGAKINI